MSICCKTNTQLLWRGLIRARFFRSTPGNMPDNAFYDSSEIIGYDDVSKCLRSSTLECFRPPVSTHVHANTEMRRTHRCCANYRQGEPIVPPFPHPPLCLSPTAKPPISTPHGQYALWPKPLPQPTAPSPPTIKKIFSVLLFFLIFLSFLFPLPSFFQEGLHTLRCIEQSFLCCANTPKPTRPLVAHLNGTPKTGGSSRQRRFGEAFCPARVAGGSHLERAHNSIGRGSCSMTNGVKRQRSVLGFLCIHVTLHFTHCWFNGSAAFRLDLH